MPKAAFRDRMWPAESPVSVPINRSSRRASYVALDEKLVGRRHAIHDFTQGHSGRTSPGSFLRAVKSSVHYQNLLDFITPINQGLICFPHGIQGVVRRRCSVLGLWYTKDYPIGAVSEGCRQRSCRSMRGPMGSSPLDLMGRKMKVSHGALFNALQEKKSRVLCKTWKQSQAWQRSARLATRWRRS